MTNLWTLGGLGWKELGKRVWRELMEDDVLTRGAALSYFFVLALFPALFFLTTLLGFLAETGSELRSALLGYLSPVLPRSAYQLVVTTLDEINRGAAGWKLVVGIGGAVWAASAAFAAIIGGLNVAYSVKEDRPWWKARLIAVGLTIGTTILIIAALAMLLFGDRIGQAIADSVGLGTLFGIAWNILRWLVVLGFVLVAFGLVYRFAPNVRRPEWRWITPGALTGVALWLLASFGFQLYLSYFNSYSEVYGSLGAVVILMLWLYLSGLALLIGGEVNSEIENAAAARGAPGAHPSGSKEPAYPRSR